MMFGAHLRITGLRGGAGPGVEFLEYLTPGGGRPAPADAAANDLAHWQTIVRVEDLQGLVARLGRQGASRLVSHGVVELGGRAVRERAVSVLDPDGHALEWIEP